MSNSLERLAVAWSTLADCWQQTRSQWRDGTALEFERRFWQEVERQTRELMVAAERLDEALACALRDCD